jgi:hypothetical protein
MWQIYPDHPFILQNYEAEFYLDITQQLVDYLIQFEDDDVNWIETGCVIFDRADLKQKVYLINFCLSALLKPEIDPPKLTHILEATVYYPFAYLQYQIESELEQEELEQDDDYKYSIFRYTDRRLVEKAYKKIILPSDLEIDINEIIQAKLEWTFSEQEWQEYMDEELSFLRKRLLFDFDYESTNIKQWTDMIETLAHNLVVGDDEDWKVTSFNPQLVDGVTAIEINMGIYDDYITNQLPKVSDKEYKEALENIFNFKL